MMRTCLPTSGLRMKRLKQLMQILVVILVLDGIFLLYKYQEYRLTSNVPGQSYSWGFSKFKPVALLEKYIKSDFVLSRRQANSIINLADLEAVQAASSKRRRANATDTVVFLKTHKTGSSTLQNIILRHAILYNLTIALPSYRASFFWPNTFSSQLFVKPLPGVTTFHTLAHHAIYDKAEMLKVMKPNPSFITILREPVSLFRSAFEYYNMHRYCFNTTVDNIKSSPSFNTLREDVCPSTRTPVRNLQAFDLGLRMGDMEREEAVESLIREVDESMRLVLITERFDESLILLRRTFNWSTHDIVYFKQNAQEPKSHDPNDPGATKSSESADADILQFNYADHLIYTHFNRKLDQQLREQFTKEELEKELKDFNSMQAQYRDRCVQQLATANSTFFMGRTSRYALFHPYGSHTLGYVLKPDALQDVTCRLLAMPELTLTHYLKAMPFKGVP